MKGTVSFHVLSDGGLVLTLTDFCIQTAARRAHQELAAALLAGRAENLSPCADLLERFLRTSDFSALRTDHPELAGGSHCLVRLDQNEDGTVRWGFWEST